MWQSYIISEMYICSCCNCVIRKQSFGSLIINYSWYIHEAFAVTLSHTEASVAALRRKALLCLVKIDVWEADHVSATRRIIIAYFRNPINMIYEIISCFIELIWSFVFCGWPWFFYLSQFWFRPLKGYFTQSWKFCQILCTLISQTFMASFFSSTEPDSAYLFLSIHWKSIDSKTTFDIFQQQQKNLLCVHRVKDCTWGWENEDRLSFLNEQSL